MFLDVNYNNVNEVQSNQVAMKQLATNVVSRVSDVHQKCMSELTGYTGEVGGWVINVFR